MSTKHTCLLEWNEVNFEFVRKYVEKYHLPNIKKLFERSVVTTESEKEYQNLEPWIQWVTSHTGKSFSEHGVFRLGDIINYQGDQFLEEIEEAGVTVGAISPMNTKNNLNEPSYFIPDPWTDTNSDSSLLSKTLHQVLKQTVNDNSEGKITKKSLLILLYILATKTQVKNWPWYISLVLKSRKHKWAKALFLDLMLSDIHVHLFKKNRPGFSLLFLNSFAHLQHHYFINSEFYSGDLLNPNWYIDAETDPMRVGLQTYDRIIKDAAKLVGWENFILMTGLSQNPVRKLVFYYRLRNHEKFLKMIGIDNAIVHPRMTRDFLIEFKNNDYVNVAREILENVTVNGDRVFEEIEARNNSLFVTLTYSHEIIEDDVIDNTDIKLNENVIFVALKNGEHSSVGYISQDLSSRLVPKEFSDIKLSDFRGYLCSHLKT